jgi:hypothetical protein
MIPILRDRPVKLEGGIPVPADLGAGTGHPARL